MFRQNFLKTKNNKNKNFKYLKNFKIFSIIILSTSVFMSNSYAKDKQLEVDNLTYDLNTSYNMNPQDTSIVSQFFSKLPFEYSIKTEYGNGKNINVMFLDANCPHCLEQEKIFLNDRDLVNATSYIFLVDLLEDKSKINEYIWCSKNREEKLKSWYQYKNKHNNTPSGILFAQWKQENKYPEIESCKTPFEFNKYLMAKYYSQDGYIQTPTLVFSNGMVNYGVTNMNNYINIIKYVKKYPLEIPNYEYFNSDETLQKLQFIKDEFLKYKKEEK